MRNGCSVFWQCLGIYDPFIVKTTRWRSDIRYALLENIETVVPLLNSCGELSKISKLSLFRPPQQADKNVGGNVIFMWGYQRFYTVTLALSKIEIIFKELLYAHNLYVVIYVTI